MYRITWRINAYVLTSQETTTKRRVGDNSDAELLARFEESDLLVFDIEREGRVLDLEGRDGVHRMRATESLLRAFGQANVANLSLPEYQRSDNCLGERSKGLLTSRALP